MVYDLSISDFHYNQIKLHLFPGDEKEAVAVAICGRYQYKDKTRLLVKDIFLVSYSECVHRSAGLVKWNLRCIHPLLSKASKEAFSILYIHSHPTGYSTFSSTDNDNDEHLYDAFYGYAEDGPHASAIMLPDGRIFGRVWVWGKEKKFVPFRCVKYVGDDVRFWFDDDKKIFGNSGFSLRTIQTFGQGTFDLLQKLKIAVIGASGTGAPLIEQLYRIGVGSLVIIDPDRVEEKNLNRIVNATMHDAEKKRYKTTVLKQAIKKAGLGTEVIDIHKNLYDDPNIIRAIADCDFIFGCVDSIDGRHLLNQLASFYLIPYIDMGVRLESNGKGGIDSIFFMVQYLKPFGSSFLTRRFYSNEELRAAGLLRTAPEEYKRMRQIGYIADIPLDNPAVISFDMQTSTFAVNDFLARIHSYRYDPNEEYAIMRFNVTGCYMLFEKEDQYEQDQYLARFAGRGDMNPMLNMPELSC